MLDLTYFSNICTGLDFSYLYQIGGLSVHYLAFFWLNDNYLECV